MSVKRGSFLTNIAGLSALAAGVRPDVAAAQTPATSGIPRRAFGRHRDTISALGMGGHHLGSAASVAVATAMVHEAIDGGITFFDNAWEYNNHRSEEYLGAGLRGGYRDRVFLMTKVCTHGRDASVAMQQLEESLTRLGTDHLDLWQVHAITYDNDPDLAYRTNGVIEALDRAKQQGKVRYVGFSGNKDPRLHRRMIDLGYHFDSVQFPINAFDAQFRSFQSLVLPEAVKRGIAVLGMKPFGGQGQPFHRGEVKMTPQQALRFAMSVPGVTTTITGMETPEVLRQNLAIAQNFTPMDAAERAELIAAVAPFAGDGRYETYKTSIAYDNIITRQMHGFPLQGANA
jgi:aryl-alcohol dehydrogenase-like predicted oxidoreductase